MNDEPPPLYEAPAAAFLTWFAQTFMLLFLFLSLIYGVQELTLFALFLISLGTGTFAWSRISLNRLRCRILLDRYRMFPGETLTLRLRITNSKLLPLLFKIDLFVPGALDGHHSGSWVREEIGLLWYQHVDLTRQCHPRRRGVFDLGPPTLSGGDLFGFFSRKQVGKDRVEVVVYPRRAEIRPLALPRRDFFGVPGTRSPVEDPIYVFGTRDYQSGRPARGIHWKASARHGRLQEKLCEPAEQQKLLIVLDTAGFGDESAREDFERTLEVIASVALQVDSRGNAVGFTTNGRLIGSARRIIPISRQSQQMAAILEALARVTPAAAEPITELLARGYRVPWGASVLFFSYRYDQYTHAVGAHLRNRHIFMQTVTARQSSPGGVSADFQLGDILSGGKTKR
ncbi:MAG: DUF58 domain-containing protein [Deltaproteobacteria bacterium]|nr:DUF58 domain-containing protein [Deltaproteobacteria bacterium]MBW1955689.1 DUF58 domain-containing protein [Deltaproteobacteria bacterium]